MLVWSKNKDSIYTGANDICARVFGFKNPEAMGGITDYEIPCKFSELGGVYREHDQQVIATRQSLKLLEITQCTNDVWKIFITTKSPIINANLKRMILIIQSLEIIVC